MALTVADIAQAIRVPVDDFTTAEITRLQKFAETVIRRYADGAPEAIEDEATIRIIGYLYESPTVSNANALEKSGAAAMLLPYRVHRAGIVDGAQPTTITPSGGGTQPSGGGGGGGGASEAQIRDLQGQIDDLEADLMAEIDERGVEEGGTQGQILAKKSADDYDTEWINNTGTDVSDIAADVEVLKHATRQIEVLDVDEWKTGVAPNQVQVTIVPVDGINNGKVQNSPHWASRIDNPHSIFGNVEVLLYLRVQRDHRGDSAAKSQIRFVSNNRDRNTNNYTYGSQMEVDETLEQSTWRYYQVFWLGLNEFIPGEATGYYAAEYHETERTVYEGTVGADALIDDVEASTIADAVVPGGGIVGAVLTKSSNADYGYSWRLPSTSAFSLTKLNSSETAQTFSRTQNTFNSDDSLTIWKARGKPWYLEIRKNNSTNTFGTVLPIYTRVLFFKDYTQTLSPDHQSFDIQWADWIKGMLAAFVLHVTKPVEHVTAAKVVLHVNQLSLTTDTVGTSGSARQLGIPIAPSLGTVLADNETIDLYSF